MVSSGMGMFGEEKFDLFEQWFSSQKRSMFPRDFLYWAGEGFVWLHLCEEGMEVPPEFGLKQKRRMVYIICAMRLCVVIDF